MKKHAATIEFDVILNQLAALALSERAKEWALALAPSLYEAECRARIQEVADARAILKAEGSPPLAPMKELRRVLQLAGAGAMLSPEQLTAVASFVNTVGRMKRYLKKSGLPDNGVAAYGQSLAELPELYEEIDTSIRGDAVDDAASAELKSVRRKMDMSREAIKTKLESMLRSNRDWYSESFIVTRGGRFALPVKKEHKHQVAGAAIDVSSSGNTVFIEPTQARKLTDALSLLEIAEENEVRRILYTLSATVESYSRELALDAECMEALDFVFAKAQLAEGMRATAPVVTTRREIRIADGRHPLLRPEGCVPLNLSLGDGVRGVVITGPNTGGKTVALKTVGLLSLMAQSGLHVPAGEGSVFAMHASVLCDIGDGQSISENLSTFSSHMTNIIGILGDATHESLVLLDELGSGTDPAEGMGLAVAVLEELRVRGCLFVATSHYPEVKEYAAAADGLINARMAFDRESLEPLYRLEMGEAGESCALYIAKRLGFPAHLLARAEKAAYAARGDAQDARGPLPDMEPAPSPTPPAGPSVLRAEGIKDAPPRRCDRFTVGDSVRVHPEKDIGIVCRRADAKGQVCVQVRGDKRLVPHKRLQLLVAADALYPDDYDFSIVFDTVANRKARHRQEKGHTDAEVRYEDGFAGQ